MSGMTVTASDVVNIIKAAKGAGVKYLKYETLEMEFDTEKHLYKHKINTSHREVIGVDEVAQPPESTLSPSQDTDEEMLLNEHLDQMAIESPAEYEELQLRLLNEGRDS
jgi:restriction endonuclease Mrr